MHHNQLCRRNQGAWQEPAISGAGLCWQGGSRLLQRPCRCRGRSLSEGVVCLLVEFLHWLSRNAQRQCWSALR